MTSLGISRFFDSARSLRFSKNAADPFLTHRFPNCPSIERKHLLSTTRRRSQEPSNAVNLTTIGKAIGSSSPASAFFDRLPLTALRMKLTRGSSVVPRQEIKPCCGQDRESRYSRGLFLTAHQWTLFTELRSSMTSGSAIQKRSTATTHSHTFEQVGLGTRESVRITALSFPGAMKSFLSACFRCNASIESIRHEDAMTSFDIFHLKKLDYL